MGLLDLGRAVHPSIDHLLTHVQNNHHRYCHHHHRIGRHRSAGCRMHSHRIEEGLVEDQLVLVLDLEQASRLQLGQGPVQGPVQG